MQSTRKCFTEKGSWQGIHKGQSSPFSKNECVIKVWLILSPGSGGAMVLGKLPVPGRPTIWMIVGQEPIALAVGAGGGCLDIFTLLYPFSPLFPSLCETARYRLKYCLKGPLNPKQPTNHLSRAKVTSSLRFIL